MKDYFAGIDFSGVTGVTRCDDFSNSNRNNNLNNIQTITPIDNGTCDRCDSSNANHNFTSHPVTPYKAQGVMQKVLENKAVTPITPVTPKKEQALYLYELYQERAAILEYDAELPRHEAENIAYIEILEQYVSEHYPSIKAKIETIIKQPTVN